MRLYRSNASSSIRLDYGIALVTGLRHFPETAPLATDLAAINEELAAAQAARTTKQKPLTEARAELRFAEFNVDQTIRAMARSVESAEGGRKGPLTAALFPDGLGPVVAPSGSRQVKPTRQLIERLCGCRIPAAEAARAEWQPKLAAALEKLEQCVERHDTLRTAYQDAFRAESHLRDEHERTVDKIIGLVRATFPRDRSRQDVIFPVARTPRGGSDGDVADDEVDGADDPAAES